MTNQFVTALPGDFAPGTLQAIVNRNMSALPCIDCLQCLQCLQCVQCVQCVSCVSCFGI